MPERPPARALLWAKACVLACRISYSWLCLFSVAFVTNYRNLYGLKQHKSILLQFQKWEVQRGSPWAKMKVSAAPCFFLEALGEKSMSCFFWLFEATHIPWLGAPCSGFRASDNRLSPHATHLQLPFLLPCFFSRTLVITLRWFRIISLFPSQLISNLNSVFNFNSFFLFVFCMWHKIFTDSRD